MMSGLVLLRLPYVLPVHLDNLLGQALEALEGGASELPSLTASIAS